VAAIKSAPFVLISMALTLPKAMPFFVVNNLPLDVDEDLHTRTLPSLVPTPRMKLPLDVGSTSLWQESSSTFSLLASMIFKDVGNYVKLIL